MNSLSIEVIKPFIHWVTAHYTISLILEPPFSSLSSGGTLDSKELEIDYSSSYYDGTQDD